MVSKIVIFTLLRTKTIGGFNHQFRFIDLFRFFCFQQSIGGRLGRHGIRSSPGTISVKDPQFALKAQISYYIYILLIKCLIVEVHPLRLYAFTLSLLLFRSGSPRCFAAGLGPDILSMMRRSSLLKGAFEKINLAAPWHKMVKFHRDRKHVLQKSSKMYIAFWKGTWVF